MGFWIFMLASVLLVPALMLIFGRIFMTKPPTTINFGYGYRSSRSMKSQEAWDFAQRYMGKIWWKTGGVLFGVSIVIMLLFLGKDKDTIGWLGAIYAQVECAVMVVAIFIVESALKKNFDKDGNRIGKRNENRIEGRNE